MSKDLRRMRHRFPARLMPIVFKTVVLVAQAAILVMKIIRHDE